MPLNVNSIKALNVLTFGLQDRRFPGPLAALEAHIYGECVFKCILTVLISRQTNS